MANEASSMCSSRMGASLHERCAPAPARVAWFPSWKDCSAASAWWSKAHSFSTPKPSNCCKPVVLKLLIEFCVHRRLAVLFATLVLAVFGLRAYLDTPIEAYPDV